VSDEPTKEIPRIPLANSIHPAARDALREMEEHIWGALFDAGKKGVAAFAVLGVLTAVHHNYLTHVADIHYNVDDEED
jgi:hypothetical protein